MTSAQLRLDQVSLAPQLFKVAKPKSQVLAQAEMYYLLQSVSFEVFQGDRIAIVGPSGAGKSSLLRLLNRLSEPTSGTLYFNNQSFSSIPVIQLRQQIVLMLQESKLLGMTVQDALAYSLRLRGFSKQAIQQQVQEWMERMHLPQDWLNRTEQQLSVGQRQLVAIARVLMLQPKVLLLDEPTSSLDVGRSHQILALLADLAQTNGTTILMANHQLELAQKFCTRLLYFQQGRLLHDHLAPQVDWQILEHKLQAAETEQIAEWQ